MTRDGLSSACLALFAAFMTLVGGVQAGTVSLELRPGVQRVTSGSPVTLGLYAVSDATSDQPFSGIDALPVWDPAVIALVGLTNNGPYAWLSSWFPTDGLLDGMNDTWLDGNAFYQAFGPLAPTPPAEATPDGLLVTTLRFQANGAGATALSFLPTFGTFSVTRVHDAFIPGFFVTGSLNGATVIVASCGVAADVDTDCDVDLDDVTAYDACLTGPDQLPTSSCVFRDLDADNRVDLRDFAETQRSFTGP